MATRLIRAKTSSNVTAGYNNLGSNGTVGQKIANAVDSTGASTGISIHVTGAFSGSGGSGSTWSTADYHSLVENYWEWAWNSSTSGVGIIELRGFPVGKSVTIGLTGWALNATRHTDFFVNGVALSRYTNKSTLPPNAPVTIAAVTDSNGYITITGNLTNSFWYFNGLTASYEDNPLINSIDKLESTSLSTAVTSDASYSANSVNITSNAVTKTIVATDTGSGAFTFTPPAWVDGETSLKYGILNTVIATNGTTPTQPITSTLTLPSPLAFVDLTSVSADSLDKIASFSPSWKIGTQVVYDTTKGTVYANGEYDDLIFDGEFWVSSGFEGTTQIWDRDPDDKIARLGNLILQNGGVVVDTNPAADTFGTVSGRPLSTPTPAAKTITLAGMTPDVDVLAVASGGLRYRVSTDGGVTFGALTTASTNVRNGYVLDADITSSDVVSTTVTGTLTVGTTAFTLVVTTRAADNVPNILMFSPFTEAELLSEHTSETETVSGMDVGESSTFTVANGTYSKNGGAFVSTAGSMQNGDTFALRGTSDTYFGRSKDVILTAANGPVISTYRITNKLDPLLPTGGGSTVVGQFLTGYTL